MRKAKPKNKIIHSLEYDFEVHVSADKNPYIRTYDPDWKPLKTPEPLRRHKIVIQVVLNKYEDDPDRFKVDKMTFNGKSHFVFNFIDEKEFDSNKPYTHQYPYPIIQEIYSKIIYELMVSGYLNILIKDLKVVNTKEVKEDDTNTNMDSAASAS